MLLIEGLRVDLGDRGVHASQPGVALQEADPKGCVAHPQPWVAALVGIMLPILGLGLGQGGGRGGGGQGEVYRADLKGTSVALKWYSLRPS